MSLDTKRVQAIFRAALDATSLLDRAAIVQRECAGDSELRQGVEALLHAYDEPARLLDQPAVVQPDGANPPQQRYQLLGEIARGSMAALYRATDTALCCEVALKVLQSWYDPGSGVARRFADEARITAQLQHPGIPPVHDLGTLPDHRPFFTMKLVKGKTLATLLAERTDPRQDLPRFLAVFQQVCQTLGYAHAKGVIHRNLSPSNIMIGAFGEVQVMDWGLAKVLPHDTSFSRDAQRSASADALRCASRLNEEGAAQAGMVLGTPAYMAPEQARGEMHRVDERADVFGLGAILCEILTGSPPFPAERIATARQVRENALADALTRLAGCGADAELVALATACLAAEPEQRPQNAGEVAQAIGACQQSWETRWCQAELAEARASEQRKWRRLTLALTAVVLALVGLSGYLYLLVKS
jgi:serine/threonine-protein kinase